MRNFIVRITVIVSVFLMNACSNSQTETNNYNNDTISDEIVSTNVEITNTNDIKFEFWGGKTVAEMNEKLNSFIASMDTTSEEYFDIKIITNVTVGIKRNDYRTLMNCLFCADGVGLTPKETYSGFQYIDSIGIKPIFETIKSELIEKNWKNIDFDNQNTSSPKLDSLRAQIERINQLVEQMQNDGIQINK